MKTTYTRTELDLLPARTTEGSFVKAALMRLLVVFRALRNRREVMNLEDFTDQQLADIGLTRGDVTHSLATPWYDDPSSYLTQSARRRRARGDYRL